MKSISFAALVLFFLSFNTLPGSYRITSAGYSDTGHVIHILDGLTTEWPADKFQPNNDSTIDFAVDNDDKNLYVAMSIPDFDMQMKLMRNGMKLFIDLKGKKKEGRGIEFPVKGEATNLSGAFSSVNTSDANGDQQKRKVDKKSVRNIMSLGLTALKLFGFNDNSEDEQGLTMEGSVNIAFKWDSNDVMHLEYNIPLNLLGEPSSLNQKDISIGWKINAFERPERPAGMEQGENAGGMGGGGFGGGGRGGGGFGGGRGGGGRGFGGGRSGGNSRRLDPEEMRKEQSFWTKYVIANTTAVKKAF